MSVQKTLLLGIDVGSTTVKGVVTDNEFNVLHAQYKRHNARQPEHVRELLQTVTDKFPDTAFDTFITGSGGRVIAPHINARYIQEVNAVTYAVEKLHPDTRSVIELGGQDAKAIIWKGEDEDRHTLTFMNDKCAGGTGATIDKILTKIGMNPEEAADVTLEGKTVHHVAAKCGVFAETDVVGLVKAGIDKEEILVSLCSAVVKQNLEVLVKGNVLQDRVLLLGGPHTYIKVFTELWRNEIPKTWDIHNWTPNGNSLEEMIYVPDDAQYFAAMGALLYGKKTEELYSEMNENQKVSSHLLGSIDKLDSYIDKGRLEQLASSGAIRDGLVKDNEELEQFKKEYTIPEFIEPDLNGINSLDCYIGIDGGSTSTKLVLVDENKRLVYKDYLLSKGNPITDLREMFINMNEWSEDRKIALNIKGTAVTGYASAIVTEAFGMDSAVVETVAHMRSSVAQYGDVDVICDVGGQDIKVLFMKHGRVVDFKLNTQCSAGNGYFLQGMAEQFNLPIEEYAEHAFTAEKAPAFNYGCAVFMEQDKVNFQQLGWKKEEIMAGLALVLPLNIWNYVVQETNIGKYGHRIVLQGGTQKNLAAVKAQVDYLKEKVPGAEVLVHKYSDVAGAIGAAFEIIERGVSDKSKFIGIDAACNISFTSKNDESTRCNFCNNKCARTFIDINVDDNFGPVRFISGYGCDKGEVESLEEMKSRESTKKELKKNHPNLVHEAAVDVFKEYDFEEIPKAGEKIARAQYYPYDEKNHKKMKKPTAFERSDDGKRSQMVIGIPKLLNMFIYNPFFSTYFRALGVKKVVYSGYTSQKLWSKGNKWGAIDPCFPAKVAPAHVYDLIDKGECTHICFPMITHLQSTVDNTLGNNACVIQMGTPEVIDAVFTRDVDYFKKHNMEYWKPLVSMDKPREVTGLLFEYFKDRLGITEDENAWAVAQGHKAMREYVDTLRHKGSDVLNDVIKEDRLAVMLIGHPYHHDPGLNHGILDSFQALGYPVLSIESLPVDDSFLKPLFGQDKDINSFFPSETDIKDVWERNFNRNTNLKIWAAKVAARHSNIAVIDLSSFKCGHDAPTYSYIDNIMDASETPHFLFHDVDQNKPGATFDIRIKTIDYFLKLEEERLKEKAGKQNG